MGLITRNINKSEEGEIEDLDRIYREFNGNIDNANIMDSAAIDYSKLNLTDSILNADINSSAAIAISKTTLGTFTDWTAWTPTFTGFSTDPIVTARYMRLGNLAIVVLLTNTHGTSNATSFTITNAPYTAANTAYTPLSRTRDNSANVTPNGIATIGGSGTTITCYKTSAFGAWTASNDKSANFTFLYEI